MTDHIEMKCPKCGQQLRMPKNIGGLLMACPTCGEKIYSDFKLGGARKTAYRNVFIVVFEMPYKILCRIARFFHF